ncbi:methylated-DNA--[protein]-cysteine S-methyltransferase [uncultured Clostridium sp.]|uniref:methylated-DNA--[protein]-cysteine S-methyltransferase n=1 Tax=uncultured Clostridium sp. TaxID=59620 RepID=UPI0026362FD8|nr:methylated-DNA--[protein]-cysteine S-methyltransferase [uncultured Clostridium sp.]
MNKKYYGYYESPIGVLKIEASEKVLFGVDFVEKKEEVLEKTEFIEEVIRQLDEYFKGERMNFNLEVELEGTEFQKKAWTALMEIPYGKTISYKEQAMKIENEKAVRAIGGANGKNNIAIIIPCHRVIGSNKKLTGYNGGIDKKGWLLNHESKFYIKND